MQESKPKTYTGGTFRENLLSYSKDRLTRDPKYRRDFVKSQAEKRERRKAQLNGGAK